LSKDELLKAAIAATRAGNRAQAAGLFTQVVKLDPNNEQAWLGLGFCLSDPQRRAYCFQRVLAINPANPLAAKELASQPKPPAPPPPPPPAPSPVKSSPFVEQKTPAFSFDDPPPVALSQEEPTPQKSSVFSADLWDDDEPTQQPFESDGDEQADDESQAKKRANRPLRMALAMLALVAAIGAILGVGFGILGWGADNASELPTLSGTAAPTRTPPPTPSPTSDAPTPIPSPLPTIVYAPIYESAVCPFDAPRATSCGYLTVPESRTGDPARTIQLAVAVYRSRSQTPAEPVLFLQGGPGAGALTLSAYAYDELVSPFLANHDFIVFDQRGTGFSEPAMACDELTKMYSQDLRGLIDSSTRKLVYANAFNECNALMRANGIQLQAYTSLESAADVRDLVIALGYEKANLYGVSYGTRLAQVVMREYPEVVQTAILDSVVPVNTSVVESYFSAIDSGFETLFTACTLDPACNRAYPNLEETFWNLVHDLDENPVPVSSTTPGGVVTQMVDGNLLMDLVAGSIKNSRFIGTAPQTISRFKSGDYSTLIMQQSSLLFALDGIAPGLYINMICHEQVLATTIEATAAATDPKYMRELSLHPFHGGLGDIFKTCRNWGALPPAYGENDLLVSDIPTLILAGSYDPTTPPDYGKQIAPDLSNHYYFEFPNLGHAVSTADSTGCAIDIVRQFLDNPAREPGRACMNSLEPPVFVVPYTGEPALLLQSVISNGYRMSVPRDWQSDGTGYYYRGNSPFDITEVGLLRVRGSIASIEEHFGSQLHGYRGLDGPLQPTGERKTGRYAWQLFTSTSYGRPVDFAMTEEQGWTIILMFFSSPDEYQALYETVFLPMIDSVRR
jgi:pimeloyl-ACP methyl ester carboxylesterase